MWLGQITGELVSLLETWASCLRVASAVTRPDWGSVVNSAWCLSHLPVICLSSQQGCGLLSMSAFLSFCHVILVLCDASAF